VICWDLVYKDLRFDKERKKQPNSIYDGNGLLFYFYLFYGYFNSLPSANQKGLEQKKVQKDPHFLHALPDNSCFTKFGLHPLAISIYSQI
jgi:hypothetical protein